jgi:hypothetical protein
VFGLRSGTVAEPAGAPAATAFGGRAGPLGLLVRCSLDSTPQDSVVTRLDSGRVIGRTPLTIALPKSQEVIAFRFEKPGREAVVYKVIPDLDKAVRVDLPQPAAAAAGAFATSGASAGNHSRTALPRAPAAGRKASHSPSQSGPLGDIRNATPIDPFKM